MKVVRCTNGHYYDSDKYVTCPHCGAENASGGNQNDKSADASSGSGGFAQMTNADQYYYRNEVSQINQADFKMPNMNLNSNSVGDYPQTVCYDYAYPEQNPSTATGSTWNNNPGNMNTVVGDSVQTQAGENRDNSNSQINNVDESYQKTQAGFVDVYSNEAYVAEAAPTATLNVPVMPSLRQNQFQQVPPNGFNYSDDYYGENKTSRMDNDVHYDETAVLVSGGIKTVTPSAKAALTQVSTGQRFFITKNETVIGKINTKVQNDISVSNSTVSRRHACIYIINDKLFIEDLGSTNKTHINGIDIGSNRMVELKDNDVLVLSDEEFILSLI